METKIRIGIVGAGVNGIGCAYAILNSFKDVSVTVYGNHFTPYTTGDGSAGFWSPYIIEGTPDDIINKWSKATWDFFLDCWKKKTLGVFLTHTRKISKDNIVLPAWKNIPYDYKEFTQEELKEFGREYVYGHSYSAFVCEPKILLPRLMSRVAQLGGKFERKHLRKLEDLADSADIIINCSGIGAYNLVNDLNVYPIRGQMIRVAANPFIKRCTFDLSEDSFAYIIPNSRAIVLGGTHQEDDWRTTIDVEDRKRIWKNTTRLEPSLKNQKIVDEWVGLRPTRKGGVRLEEEIIKINSRKISVIHNYGHGGSGVTTFWGCSLDVKDLLGKILHRDHAPVRSKL